jgi:quinohemoprotein ethanol dehydrogenase
VRPASAIPLRGWPSIIALKAKTGEYVWHFQEVHHDIWDYDAASPVVLFDTVIETNA